jgi:glycosyltransferase involved in cell wall biosynthesis
MVWKRFHPPRSATPALSLLTAGQPVSDARAQLHVAINAVPLLSQSTGIGRYTRSLADSLAASGEVELHLFYGGGWSNEIRRKPMKALQPLKNLIKKVVPNAHTLNRFVQDARFRRGAREKACDLYHETNYLPFSFAGPIVVSVHDLSWIRYAETHPAMRVEIMNRLFPNALERADHIVTDAAYTRDEIIAMFGVRPDRITSVPLGAREIFTPRSAAACSAVLRANDLVYRSYVLCVGTLEPRKNLELVIRTYSAMPASYRSSIPLVVVGMRGWLSSKLESLMRPLVSSGQVRLLGYTADDALAMLYAGAKVLVYPSLYEGFGLPPLEAMASRTPVIVSNRSTLPELVGDAGVLLEPHDDRALRDALLRFQSDRVWWEERAEAGFRQASRFSWQRCARETLAVYRQVLGAS